MGTSLTTPIPQEDITHQAIVRVDFIVPHKLTPTGDDIVFDKDGIRAIYQVKTYDADMNETNTEVESGAWLSFPQAFKDELKAVYDRLVADAKGKGLIGVGTDEVLS